MVVGLNIDGALTNAPCEVLESFEEFVLQNGKNLPAYCAKGKSWEEKYPGLPKEIYEAFRLKEKRVLRKMRVCSSAKHAVQKLWEAGIDTMMVTTRDNTVESHQDIEETLKEADIPMRIGFAKKGSDLADVWGLDCLIEGFAEKKETGSATLRITTWEPGSKHFSKFRSIEDAVDYILAS